MRHYLTAMRKYAVFQGRASRAEFWWFTLVYGVLLVAASILDAALGTSTPRSGRIVDVVQLIHFLPALSVYVRRLHDRDHSGLWILISLTIIGVIIPIVFSLQRGTAGPNRFGPDPYARPGADFVEPVLSDVRGEFYEPTSAPLREMPPVRPAVPGHRDDRASGDPIAEIERLAYLRQEGSISDAEFDVLKARAMSRER